MQCTCDYLQTRLTCADPCMPTSCRILPTEIATTSWICMESDWSFHVCSWQSQLDGYVR